MQLHNLTAYKIAIFIIFLAVIVFTILTYLPILTGDDPTSRIAAAQSAISVADQRIVLIGTGGAFGLGIGIILGVLRAYHKEVVDI